MSATPINVTVHCAAQDMSLTGAAEGKAGRLPPGKILPPSANSSSVKKSSYFKMLYAIISRIPNEHCKILHFIPDPLTRGSANEPSPLILSRTDNLRFLHS